MTKNEVSELSAVRGALFTRLVVLSVIKAGYEHAEPLPLEETHALIVKRARELVSGDAPEVTSHD